MDSVGVLNFPSLHRPKSFKGRLYLELEIKISEFNHEIETVGYFVAV